MDVLSRLQSLGILAASLWTYPTGSLGPFSPLFYAPLVAPGIVRRGMDAAQVMALVSLFPGLAHPRGLAAILGAQGLREGLFTVAHRRAFRPWGTP